MYFSALMGCLFYLLELLEHLLWYFIALIKTKSQVSDPLYPLDSLADEFEYGSVKCTACYCPER